MRYATSRNRQQELSHKIAEWKKIARYLTIKEAQINSIQRDYDGHTQEQTYQMLLLWKRKKGDDATYRALVQALRQAQLNDLADELSPKQGKMDIIS
ncbi:FAS-associated death domain protein [Holothuria leucospilota]|uniref:FAS-associated death domain protein n=1 Tax=Holothuria leucospilota TaxID=206669 RepID=A0A9Q1BJE4_HOLLE|nr:FAS-associated death domain protein [Holothuria leucospilota]